VVWTASQANYANAAIDFLDPDCQFVSHRLHRDHCTFSHGVHLKDLRRLNRSLEQMVIVDNSVFSFLLQLSNGVPVLPYYEGSDDKELMKLLEYLKQLLQEPDVRVSNSQYFELSRYRKHRPSSWVLR
jgi:CTD small phosphatase-like protein 2